MELGVFNQHLRQHTEIADDLPQRDLLDKMDPVHVDEPWVEVVIEQNVAGLKIPMDEAAVVQAGQDAGEAFHDASRTPIAPVRDSRERLRAANLIANEIGGYGPAKPSHLGNSQHLWRRDTRLFQARSANECAARARSAKHIFEAVRPFAVVHSPHNKPPS